MARVPKRKTERAPAVDRLLKPAVGVVLAMMAYYMFQGLQSEIPQIDVDDELILREVFFGEGEGKNYVVLCHAPPKDSASKSIPVSSVFQDARNDGNVKAEFMLMDCNHVLPSGKSVVDRFGFDIKKRPTVFVSGEVGPPKQIPLKHLKTGAMLVKVLRGLLEPHAAKIENTKVLKSKCLNKDMCGLLLKGGPVEPHVKEAMQNLIVDYPNIQFASVDSSVLLVTNLENSDLTAYTKGQHRFILFKKISGSIEASNATDADNSRLISSTASYDGRSFHYSALSTFVNDASNERVKFTKIPALPAVKTRTKKMEAQERKKWERAQQRREQKANGGSSSQRSGGSSGSGAFDINDGSKEGRKAERDRRRAEHHAKNNVKELTPEQMAERERQRRKRMEEESAKWNIMPEDEEEDIPDGDVGEGDDTFDFDEDLDEEDDLDLDEEDVMDLD
eukprot:CAMPEP_0195518538 /NCGR_PEP_ID=MMETSP0794_2-20130614/13101_1 /TAXON_ID=515487 /ORGANISM="Stephanopyxis turris, Strain CCMP 815" /LENGTH=447 /DNA_ID=CAMNT_0040647521 /DNA_START=26 /DNA_END=1369 /DNA_ORIENTATION=-